MLESVKPELAKKKAGAADVRSYLTSQVYARLRAALLARRLRTDRPLEHADVYRVVVLTIADLAREGWELAVIPRLRAIRYSVSGGGYAVELEGGIEMPARRPCVRDDDQSTDTSAKKGNGS